MGMVGATLRDGGGPGVGVCTWIGGWKGGLEINVLDGRVSGGGDCG